MVPPLAPLSLPEAIFVDIRHSFQMSVVWRELATDVCRDSQALRSTAIEMRVWSRHVRAQHALLWAESVALCHAHGPPEAQQTRG